MQPRTRGNLARGLRSDELISFVSSQRARTAVAFGNDEVGGVDRGNLGRGREGA